MPDSIVISGTGLYNPPETITNDELVACFNEYVETYNEAHAKEIEAGELGPLQPSSAAFIEKASGIKSRFVMEKAGILDTERMYSRITDRPNDEQSIQCEMAVAAARDALNNAGKEASEVDAVIMACSNMQRAYPAVSIEVQDALGINGYAYDMNVACSSATFGLQAARDAIYAGSARCVLMVNPEICSGHLNFRDRDSHFIFGDVATAAVIETAEGHNAANAWEILGTRLQTRFSNNIRNNFGFLNRCDDSGVGARDKLFIQNGRKVFKDVVPMVAEQIGAHLDHAGIPIDEVKRLWLHQANLNMNQLIAKRVFGREATPEEAPVILDQYANTSSAGSIIAFHQCRQGLAPGDIGVISSFGAGYSVGTVIVKSV